jgi:hypothetical protein
MARMAWRIHDSVIRGEIDNRRKGRIRGTLWLAGLATPLTLELTGNACADLAGCLLTFTNRHPAIPLRQDATLATVQRGRIGDLTASRKVRVDEVPNAETRARIDRGQGCGPARPGLHGRLSQTRARSPAPDPGRPRNCRGQTAPARRPGPPPANVPRGRSTA